MEAAEFASDSIADAKARGFGTPVQKRASRVPVPTSAGGAATTAVFVALIGRPEVMRFDTIRFTRPTHEILELLAHRMTPKMVIG